MAALANSIINPVAESMGLFTFESGKIAGTTLHIAGDDRQAKASITMQRGDQNIFPLKDPVKDDHLKKKSLIGFFVSTFVIKKQTFPAIRKRHRRRWYQCTGATAAASLILKSVLTGIVKKHRASDEVCEPIGLLWMDGAEK